jgi:L-ornithine N5-monooxygenase
MNGSEGEIALSSREPSGSSVDGTVHDIVGIGFGPSNLALAIAAEEVRGTGGTVDAVFLERQPEFGWHQGMLIDGAVMQVSFLKDLATMRNPTSGYGFVSYLNSRGRLADFVNHKILYPSREEFHDYLSWAAASLHPVVRYGTEAVLVRPVPGADLVAVECRTVDGTAQHSYLARNVVFAPGLRPTVPAGVTLSDRVWHSSEMLHRVKRIPAGAPRRFVVVGAGQSAAECTEYLHRTFPRAEVCAVFTRYGYSPADDSPYANRIFDAAAVGEFFRADRDVRERLLAYHRNTNYSVVDPDLIEDLYGREYQEKVRGEQRLRMINSSRVLDVSTGRAGVQVVVHHLLDDSTTRLDADAVVFATGYVPTDIAPLLGELAAHCERDADGELVVERDYRVRTSVQVRCGLYLQGGTEHSHGITSSLLSNVAVRAGEILDSVLEHRRRAADATALLPVLSGNHD